MHQDCQRGFKGPIRSDGTRTSGRDSFLQIFQWTELNWSLTHRGTASLVPQPPEFMALLKQPLAVLSNEFFWPRARAGLCSLAWKNTLICFTSVTWLISTAS